MAATTTQGNPNPGAAPVADESTKRWSEGYVAVEYEAADLLLDVKHPARSLWLAGRIWCSRHATDGMIPCAMLGRIGRDAGMTMMGAPPAAAELVKAGLWQRQGAKHWCDIGFALHNISRQARTKRRASWQLAQRKHRALEAAANTDDAIVNDMSTRNVTKRNYLKSNVPDARASREDQPAKAAEDGVPEGYELVDGCWLSPDGQHAWTP
jgi:hypothetical protein